ncbi:RmlC-like cupin domain-containing protein [Xylariaceae sp. FL0016]|nr:RmlC-like cupin domain-containing protein [Xylariaceae sp. FL0016]
MATLANLIRLFLLGTIIAQSTAQNNGNTNISIEIGFQTSELDRMNILRQESDWTFDFLSQPNYTYNPGSVLNADSTTFPATVGNGLTMAWVSLGPCAMQPPHYHPRASNYIASVAGENVTTYMIPENGGRLFTNSIWPGKMTLFPKGSLHAMQNTGCGNATIVSALNSEDPGTHTIANALFFLPKDIIYAALGQNPDTKNLDTFADLIPAVGSGITNGSAECRKRCGII